MLPPPDPLDHPSVWYGPIPAVDVTAYDSFGKGIPLGERRRLAWVCGQMAGRDLEEEAAYWDVWDAEQQVRLSCR